MVLNIGALRVPCHGLAAVLLGIVGIGNYHHDGQQVNMGASTHCRTSKDMFFDARLAETYEATTDFLDHGLKNEEC